MKPLVISYPTRKLVKLGNNSSLSMLKFYLYDNLLPASLDNNSNFV